MAGQAGTAPRALHVAADRARLPARAAPLARGIPVPRLRCAQPALRASGDRRLLPRALGTSDIRIYQSGLSAKYAGETNYEQPMHTDRNHSWLPSLPGRSAWHVEGFLYLSDVDAGNAPTHLVSVHDAVGRDTTAPLIMPARDPGIYAAERAASGPRGSYLAYRSDVFHRGVDLTDPTAVRFLMNVSYRIASCEWVGYQTAQSRATSPDWVAFVEASTPAELALFGFPSPGDDVWDDELLRATATRYPKLDLDPWWAALAGGAKAATS